MSEDKPKVVRREDYIPTLFETMFPSFFGEDFFRPFRMINRMTREGFSSLGGYCCPLREPVSVEETEGGCNFFYDMAGYNKDDIVLRPRDGGLELTVKSESSEGEEGKPGYRKEFRKGTHYMKYEGLDVENAEAEMKDGVLKVYIPRTEQVETEQEELPQIEIK